MSVAIFGAVRIEANFVMERDKVLLRLSSGLNMLDLK